MTTHTPLPVAGYKPQDQTSIDFVNRNKKLEELVLKVIDELENINLIDKRWLNIAKTDLEKGFMALNRSIFKPKRVNDLVGTEINIQSLTLAIKITEGDND